MQKFKLQLTKLEAIKFLLIILIVCIHSSPSVVEGVSLETSFQIYLSQIISRIAVPLYFFISGYLMSLGLLVFADWKRKIVSRLSSVLIPYVLWNGLYALFLLFLVFQFEISTSFLNIKTIKEFLFKTFISPAISPLWFLRDLFLFQLCSLIIISLFKWGKGLILFCLVGFWVCDFHFFNSSISTEGALFFFLGLLNLLPGYVFFKRNKKIILIVVLIFSVLDTYIRYGDFWYSLLFHRITILGLCYSFIYISSNYFNNKLNILKRISKYSFYIFVLHFPILYFVNGFLDSTYLIEYILKVIIVVVISMGIGYIINLFPKLSNFLTGNRS